MSEKETTDLDRQLQGRELRPPTDEAMHVIDISTVAGQLNQAVRLRAATPGQPGDGFYPANLDEVADEVLAWLRKMDRTNARGLAYLVLMKLGDTFDPEPPREWRSTEDPARWLRGACSSGDPLYPAVQAVCNELALRRRGEAP